MREIRMLGYKLSTTNVCDRRSEDYTIIGNPPLSLTERDIRLTDVKGSEWSA